MNKYADIINKPYIKSNKYKHMSINNRASQFAPFAALNGYEDQISDAGILRYKRIELTDEEKEILNNKLVYLNDKIKDKIYVNVIYFKDDEYKTIYNYISKINFTLQYILIDKVKISFDNILDIKSDIINMDSY